MKKAIPNLITSANLFCGCIAITQIAMGEMVLACFFVLFGAFFDFFDGMSARLLKVTSPIGVQLDSLADMTTFGIAPAYLVFEWLNAIETSSLNYGAFLLAIFSAYRLAKFNVDESQTTSFIGVPTPANALFWISFPLISWQIENKMSWLDISGLAVLISNPILIYILVGLLSLLMISEINLMSLKFKNFGIKGNEFRFMLLIFSAILFAVFYLAAIPFIITLYLILSIIQNNLKSNEI